MYQQAHRLIVLFYEDQKLVYFSWEELNIWDGICKFNRLEDSLIQRGFSQFFSNRYVQGLQAVEFYLLESETGEYSL